MKRTSTWIAYAFTVAGVLFAGTVLAAGLPLSIYRPLKLPPFTTHDGALDYTIHMQGGQISGVITADEDGMYTVTDAEGTDYTVDTESAKFVNAVGRKAKPADVVVGDLVVVDGYFALNSTGMSARRVIDVGTAPRP